MSNSQQPGVLDHPGARPQQPVAGSGRPVGVMLVALMFLFYAVVMAMNAYTAFSFLSALEQSAETYARARQDLVLSLVQLPIYIVTAIGVWRLKRWGHYLALAFLVFNIVRAVVTTFNLPLPYNLLAALSQSIIPLTIMLYLLHPMIRSVFQRDREDR